MDAQAPAKTTLLRNGAVYNPGNPFATAMVVQGGAIAWIGTESAAAAHADGVDATIDLRGALVTPAFVDAHVHATATGLNLTGLDLTGAVSAADLLSRLAAHARTLPADAVVLGSRWDETTWTDPSLPTREQLDKAADGRKVYLARVDVHSALVSASLLATASEARAAVGYLDEGPLSREAHHVVRETALAAVTPAQREAAQLAALRHAAELGLGALHECAGPQISGEDDLTALLALAARVPAPYIFGYWGDTDPAKALALGAVGAGGDLFIDGAIGSHTACLREPYADAAAQSAAAGTTDLGANAPGGYAGAAYLSESEIGDFLIRCAAANTQPGFHVIGDHALDLLAAGIDRARASLGEARVRELRIRAEHAEMPDARHIEHLARHGVVVSAQPGFDAAWGGPDGMYARRLGHQRALPMNPFAALAAAGVVLAFGSDSPVIPLGPWQAVRDAAHHRTPGSRISVQAAFKAHTSGGWRALHPAAPGVPADETGILGLGAPATYAVWETAEPLVQVADHHVTTRSTGELVGAPGLPDLAPGTPLPRCLRTAVRGRTVHDLLED